MEWNAFLLPALVLLSTATLLFISQSSNPFSIAQPKQEDEASSSSNPSSISRTFARSREDEACDLFVGKWVEEPRGSTYTNVSCATIPDTRNCGKHGKEQGYVYWKWKPDGCDLPRFDPELFLSIARGKKLAFIGDSLARNQMESLLCLLSQAETPTNIDDNKYTSDKSRTWYFPSHDFTLMVRWTEFLVQSEEIMVNGTASNSFNIALDSMNPRWADVLPELDYAILNCGNWFSRKSYVYDAGNLVGCVHCRDGRDNITSLTTSFALRSVLRAALRYVSQCEHCDENLLVVLRTYSASHFEHGQWFTGGYCNRTEPSSGSEGVLGGEVGEFRKVQLEEFERARGRVGRKKEKKKRRFELLDVTRAIMLRADGHPGEFLDRRWMKGFSDCLHWCLPGPIDMWNDLLLATMKKNVSLD
ncbi:protein ALTERED XYLOGLUCAN 4-like [Iris pallida]|uniref:Protein ALTERED XYLOGLUCAN 4-like n=1 Tax=Iris pallida TaxID=29817 RepID=A0AAX6GSN1_IRIPA|nr:protein ALTERED XYLOGLUCAN 4-like [Iris pallida]